MKLILKFTILLSLICNLCQAQFTAHKDSILWIRGMQLGCDISRFFLPLTNPGQTAIEVSVNYRLTPTLFPTVELGQEYVSFNNNILTQTAIGQYLRDNTSVLSQTESGQYLRIGCDINMRNYVKDFSNNSIFFGFRYCISNVNYKLNSNSDTTYWGIAPTLNIGNTHAFAQWVEIGTGVKVEVFNNIYLGWSLRGRMLLSKTMGQNGVFPYIIPGYGQGENSSNFGVNYSIYYQIPLMKMKTHFNLKKKITSETPKKTTTKTTSP